MSFTTKFVCRKDIHRKDNKAHVFLRVTIDRVPIRYKTGVFVDIAKWDEINQKVKGSSIESGTINHALDTARLRAIDAYSAMRLKGPQISHQEFAQLYNPTAVATDNFYSLFSEYLALQEGKYSHVTMRVMKAEMTKLQKFRPKLNISDFSLDFIASYERYMRLELGNSSNTVQKSVKKIKAVLNYLVKTKKIESNPIAGFTVRGETGKREYLTPEELAAMEKLVSDVRTNRITLQNTLRNFLFSCYTGLRFQDIKDLTYKEIVLSKKGNYLRLVMHKTHEPITIPLTDKAISLLHTNKKTDTRVFDVYSNQKTNEYLKELASLADIGKRVSFHCARHTFATIAVNLGIPVEVVQKLLGHQSIRTTQIYGKIMNQTVFEQMKKME